MHVERAIRVCGPPSGRHWARRLGTALGNSPVGLALGAALGMLFAMLNFRGRARKARR